MISSVFITTLITAVTGNFIRTTPMCQDFLCHNANINPETFRICQLIGCYNENPRTYPPPITLPPVTPPPVTPPPVNFPPSNYPPSNYPPSNYPPIDFLPSNYPPVNYPQVNAPPFPFMTMPTSYGNSVPPNNNPGSYSPPQTFPSTFPPGFPPTMYPPVTPMPTPATYPDNVSPPYYGPGSYFPPAMHPPAPFIPPAPATGPNNMIPPYYGYYPSFSWHHHSPPTPPINIPAPIKEEAANLTYGDNGQNDKIWLTKALEWPGWEVVAENIYKDVKSLKDDLEITVNGAGRFWKVKVLKEIKNQGKLDLLRELRKTLDDCNCTMALNMWFGALNMSSSYGTYFEQWLQEVVPSKKKADLSNMWDSQHQQQSNYNPPGYFVDAYPIFSYSMSSPHYFSNNPYAPHMSNLYQGWPSAQSYPMAMQNPLYGSVYPNTAPAYSNQQYQHQWSASGSYVPNSNPFFDATAQVNKNPVPIIQQNSSTTNTASSSTTNTASSSVTVTFSLRVFNVSQCTSSVTMEKPATLEGLLTKASDNDDCFKFTTIIYVNNPVRDGKYVDNIHGIQGTDAIPWIISKQNGATDLNLDFEPTNNDYIIINNTSA